VTALDAQFQLAAERRAKPIAMQFETDRLLIRASRLDDLDATLIVAEASVASLRDWMPWAHPAPLRESMQRYYESVEEKWASREMLDFQWLDKASGDVIGKGGFHHIDWAIPRFEIGYWLGSAYVGQGYCTEAVVGLVNFAKTALGARRLEIRSQPNNVASRAVAERTGFTLEGIHRHAIIGVDGRLKDACMYAFIVE
jgi:RimJ/RimL family protein N-acetyltransferase